MKEKNVVLDGWRGISIILVLLCHLFPLGPKEFSLNQATGILGMAIFFFLSGYLITATLSKNDSVFSFFIKRLARILPLAWLFLLITLPYYDVDFMHYLRNMLFVANFEPFALTEATEHFWSLSVEVQFYLGIGLAYALLKHNFIHIILPVALTVTALRIYNQVDYSILTIFRVDEILVGCLAFIYKEKILKILPTSKSFFYFFLLLFLLSSHRNFLYLNYFRPYFCMVVILLSFSDTCVIHGKLKNKSLVYVASISYALYVIHGGIRYTWLGDGDIVEKYVKRPLLIVVTFLLAHLSTFYYEHRIMEIARRYTKKHRK